MHHFQVLRFHSAPLFRLRTRFQLSPNPLLIQPLPASGQDQESINLLSSCPFHLPVIQVDRLLRKVLDFVHLQPQVGISEIWGGSTFRDSNSPGRCLEKSRHLILSLTPDSGTRGQIKDVFCLSVKHLHAAYNSGVGNLRPAKPRHPARNPSAKK